MVVGGACWKHLNPFGRDGAHILWMTLKPVQVRTRETVSEKS